MENTNDKNASVVSALIEENPELAAMHAAKSMLRQFEAMELPFPCRIGRVELLVPIDRYSTDGTQHAIAFGIDFKARGELDLISYDD